jgi:hypothetical protein
MDAKIRRVVLDVLKPHDPSIVELSQLLASLPGVDGVNISIYEVDRKVENAKITVEGTDLDFGVIVGTIADSGGTVHSIDEAVAGKVVIEDAPTLQDAPQVTQGWHAPALTTDLQD